MTYNPREIFTILCNCSEKFELCEAAGWIRKVMKDEDNFEHLRILAEWSAIRMDEIKKMNNNNL